MGGVGGSRRRQRVKIGHCGVFERVGRATAVVGCKGRRGRARVVRRGQIAKEDARRKLRDEVCVDVLISTVRGFVQGALVLVREVVA